MCALRVLTRFLGRCCLNNSKPYLIPNHSLLNFITVSQQILACNSIQWQHQLQSRKTLILESSASEFVKHQKLADSDSGKVPQQNLCKWLSKSVYVTKFSRLLLRTVSKSSYSNLLNTFLSLCWGSLEKDSARFFLYYFWLLMLMEMKVQSMSSSGLRSLPLLTYLTCIYIYCLPYKLHHALFYVYFRGREGDLFVITKRFGRTIECSQLFHAPWMQFEGFDLN